MTRSILLSLAAVAVISACNAAPEGGGVSIEPAGARTADDLVAVVSGVVDPNDDEVTLTYAWTLDGQVVGDLTGDTVPADRTAKDQVWEVSVVASDGKKDGEPATATITVANTPPVVTVSLAPQAPTASDDVVATPTATDADGDEVTFSYQWLVGGTASSFAGDTLAANATRRGEGWAVSVVGNDGTDDSEPATAETLIVNAVPSVVSASVDPADIFEATEVRCAAQGWVDTDGDPENYITAFLINGVRSTSSTLTGADFSKGDTIACELTPDDGLDTGTPVTSADVVVQNTPPSVVGLALAPLGPTVVDPITGSYLELVDADGDPVGLTWSWTRGGRALSEVGDTIPAGGARGEDVVLTVVPNDGEQDGEAAVATVTLENAVPVVSSVSISPTTLYTDSVAEAVYAVSDPDGDTLKVSYAWESGGTSVGSAGTLDGGSGAFSKGESVTVEVTVDDGAGGTASLTSAAVVVANTAPTAPAIAIAPEGPTTDDDLLCEITTASTDADDDRLTYTVSWTLDGTAWTGTTSTDTHSGDTIAAADLTEGDEWSCTMTVSDGTDTASAKSATVAVNDCGPVTHTSMYTTAVQMHGYCWYLGKGGQTCDTVCAAAGGKNLANDAASAFSDTCRSPGTSDVSTWFYNNGNPAGWTTTGGTAYKTLGYGYTGSAYYGKCAAGTATSHGTFPSDPNNSSTRTLACPCF